MGFNSGVKGLTVELFLLFHLSYPCESNGTTTRRKQALLFVRCLKDTEPCIGSTAHIDGGYFPCFIKEFRLADHYVRVSYHL